MRLLVHNHQPIWPVKKAQHQQQQQQQQQQRWQPTAVSGLYNRAQQAALQSKDAALIKALQYIAQQQKKRYGRVRDDDLKAVLAMQGVPGSQSWNRAGKYFTSRDWTKWRDKMTDRYKEVKHYLPYFQQQQADPGTQKMIGNIGINFAHKNLGSKAHLGKTAIPPGELRRIYEQAGDDAQRTTQAYKNTKEMPAPQYEPGWGGALNAFGDLMEGKKYKGRPMNLGDVFNVAFN